jgi:hypothetical protein
MNTYKMEEIARDLVANGGPHSAIDVRVSQIVDEFAFTGDDIRTLWDMILDIAAGLPV